MEKFLHPVELKNVSYERNKFKFQKKLKGFSFFTTTLLLMFFSFAVSAKSLSINNSNDEGWILDTIVNKVAFYHKIVLCGDKSAVLLKFDNQNLTDVTVSWNESVKTKQMPSSIIGFKGVKTVNLKTGSTSPNSCEDQNYVNLIIGSHDVDPTFIADIIDFKFIGITIK